ncbi:MOSC domain-containing protein [Campylobacter upsaliensis]|uniref:MOSC domain-containing protein n=1 Tax=Campylobacter upsaliensis TaxID=28080 RepID=UPI002B3A5F08|nr:MOSC domain-containing protein [Campylobacter upsaliensis]MEB2823300.1 MOSC domain-containing protein [Campylobacter upsaliensis]
MRLVSLQVGKIKDYEKFKSAFIKDIYLQNAFISTLGLSENEIADTKNHGGVFKAIFANATSNYKLWEEFLGKKLRYGAMGENLSLSGLDEMSVCVGDIHCLGEVVLQVSEPRSPCVKISKVHQKNDFCAKIFESGLSGRYYRVLKEGKCSVNASLEIAQKHPAKLSIMELNRLFYEPKTFLKQNPNLKEKIEQVKDILSKEWQKSIALRLKNQYDMNYMHNL